MLSPWISILISSRLQSLAARLISRQLISCSLSPCSLSGSPRTYQGVEELPPSRPAVFSVAQILGQGAQHVPRHSKAELSFPFKGKWGSSSH